MALSEALAKKIANAKVSGAGNRITDGDYVLMVKQIICEQKYKGTFYIPEFEVVESAKTHPTVEPNVKGSDCSCAFDIEAAGAKGEAARSNAKQFVCALLGLDEEKVSEADFIAKAGEYAGGKGTPDALRARGMYVACTTFRNTIKTGPNAGKEGAFPRFSHVGSEHGNTAAEVARRREALDSK